MTSAGCLNYPCRTPMYGLLQSRAAQRVGQPGTCQEPSWSLLVRFPVPRAPPGHCTASCGAPVQDRNGTRPW
jgi:hypothetical protein